MEFEANLQHLSDDSVRLITACRKWDASGTRVLGNRQWINTDKDSAAFAWIASKARCENAERPNGEVELFHAPATEIVGTSPRMAILVLDVQGTVWNLAIQAERHREMPVLGDPHAGPAPAISSWRVSNANAKDYWWHCAGWTMLLCEPKPSWVDKTSLGERFDDWLTGVYAKTIYPYSAAGRREAERAQARAKDEHKDH